uniref:Uncharacterized protein n=1 Tax=Ditylenchus dipsaci TaxID=166011 RepID=A0A915DT46_9BILA
MASSVVVVQPTVQMTTATAQQHTDATIYLPRSSYRSVAFGTWKYGEASKLFSKRNTGEKVASNECRPTGSLRFTKSLDSKCTISRVADHDAGLGGAIPKASTSTTPPSQLAAIASRDKLAKLNRKSLCFSLDNLNGDGLEEVVGAASKLLPEVHFMPPTNPGLPWHKFDSVARLLTATLPPNMSSTASQNVYENVILDSRLCPLDCPAALGTMTRQIILVPSIHLQPTTSHLQSQCPLSRNAHQTKSLDNNTKLSVMPRVRAKDERLELSKAEEQAMTTSSSVATSTLMSAKRSDCLSLKNALSCPIIFTTKTGILSAVPITKLYKRKHFSDTTPTTATNYTNSPDEGVFALLPLLPLPILPFSTPEPIWKTKANRSAQMAPVVPLNFEDFLDLSTATAILRFLVVEIEFACGTPPQSSLGYSTMTVHWMATIQMLLTIAEVPTLHLPQPAALPTLHQPHASLNYDHCLRAYKAISLKRTGEKVPELE